MVRGRLEGLSGAVFAGFNADAWIHNGRRGFLGDAGIRDANDGVAVREGQRAGLDVGRRGMGGDEPVHGKGQRPGPIILRS